MAPSIRLFTRLSVAAAFLVLLAPAKPCLAAIDGIIDASTLSTPQDPTGNIRKRLLLVADGTPCNMLSTCQNCENPATPWFDGVAIEEYRCGTQPRKAATAPKEDLLADGVPCMMGSTCQHCQNGPVHNKVFNEYICGV